MVKNKSENIENDSSQAIDTPVNPQIEVRNNIIIVRNGSWVPTGKTVFDKDLRKHVAETSFQKYRVKDYVMRIVDMSKYTNLVSLVAVGSRNVGFLLQIYESIAPILVGESLKLNFTTRKIKDSKTNLDINLPAMDFSISISNPLHYDNFSSVLDNRNLSKRFN